MSRSRIITEYDPPIIEDGVEIIGKFSPVHPGEILEEEFMEPLGLSAGQVAKACRVPRTRIERIVRGELGISADTALRLARFFAMSPDFWLNLQKRYEMLIAKEAVGDDLLKIEPLKRAA
ncbi:MAG: HigA family addiction module antitoxin [Beijerinckiaceae bacterium]